MGILRIDCPWCKIANSAFQVLLERAYRDADYNYCRQFTASCGGCKNWTLLKAEISPQSHEEAEFQTMDFEIDMDNFWNLQVWPSRPSTNAPEYTELAAGKAYSPSTQGTISK